MSSWSDPEVIAQLVGALAQAAVAVVALRIAHRSNSINKQAHFVATTLSVVSEAIGRARETRTLYKRMFSRFASVDEKTRARTEWLGARDELSATIEYLGVVAGQIDAVRAAFLKLEECEDSHAVSRALACEERLGAREVEKYERIHSGLVTALRNVIGELRTDGGDAAPAPPKLLGK